MGIFKIQKMKSTKGLTLIELLIVIVIVGVLAAIAIPTYSNYMIRARRADAKTALEQVRAAQEMFRAERGRYANNADDGNALTALQTTLGGVPATQGDYNISFTLANRTSFTAQAAPFANRQIPDGNLTINQSGVKSPAAKWAK
jgi:type IV pilus assembly protein PilE